MYYVPRRMYSVCTDDKLRLTSATVFHKGEHCGGNCIVCRTWRFLFSKNATFVFSLSCLACLVLKKCKKKKMCVFLTTLSPFKRPCRRVSSHLCHDTVADACTKPEHYLDAYSMGLLMMEIEGGQRGLHFSLKWAQLKKCLAWSGILALHGTISSFSRSKNRVCNKSAQLLLPCTINNWSRAIHAYAPMYS